MRQGLYNFSCNAQKIISNQHHNTPTTQLPLWAPNTKPDLRTIKLFCNTNVEFKHSLCIVSTNPLSNLHRLILFKSINTSHWNLLYRFTLIWEMCAYTLLRSDTPLASKMPQINNRSLKPRLLIIPSFSSNSFKAITFANSNVVELYSKMGKSTYSYNFNIKMSLFIMAVRKSVTAKISVSSVRKWLVKNTFVISVTFSL